MNETKEPTATVVDIPDAAFYKAAGLTPPKVSRTKETADLIRSTDPELADLLDSFGTSLDPD